MLRELEARGVEALDCFSVDNALVRPCDPLFVGYCADRQSDCGERSVSEPKAADCQYAGVRDALPSCWQIIMAAPIIATVPSHDVRLSPCQGRGW